MFIEEEEFCTSPLIGIAVKTLIHIIFFIFHDFFNSKKSF